MSNPGASELDQRQRARVFSTWSAQNRPTPPFEIVGGAGARFTTADGGEWLDFGSMTWNANLGHGHPRMKAALAEAAGRGLLAYPSSVFPDKARAGELLAAVTPAGLERSFIDQLEHFTVAPDYPDLTLILDLPASAGIERAELRGTLSRYDAERIETHEALREGFLEIAEQEPKRCVLIDGHLPLASVETAVWQAVNAHLLAEAD